MDFLKMVKEERAKARIQSDREAKISATIDIEKVPDKMDGEGKESQCYVANISMTSHIRFNINEDIDSFLVGTIPTAYYFPNAFDSDAESQIMRAIEESGENGVWKILSSRKLQLHGKTPQDIQPSTAMPMWLHDIISNPALLHLFCDYMRPNNILINQYEMDQGIMHHTDGPAYKDFVVILSLESDCVMTFKPKLKPSEIGLKSDEPVMSILLQPRSILIFRADLYSEYMHGIDFATEIILGMNTPCENLHLTDKQQGDKIVRKRRTSLTIREAF